MSLEGFLQKYRKTYLSRPEASDYLFDRWSVKYSKGTLAKLAVTGGGPTYRLINGYRALYKPEDLDSWVESRLSAPLNSTSQAAA
jgi:hypothetical protein